MEFELSFEPIDHNCNDYDSGQLGRNIMAYTKSSFPNLAEADLVFFSVNEYRGSGSDTINNSLDSIRKELFNLYEGLERLRIADLGHLLIGESVSDTYQLLSDVLFECEQRGLFSLIIGGSQDLTIAQYRSCVNLGKLSNLVAIDSRFDLGVNHNNNNRSYLSEILNIQPNFLFNFTNIGYQTYYNSQDSILLLDKLHFDAFRLGEIRLNIEEVEPSLRNADLMSFDMSSIRLSDNPCCLDGSPNGFYAEEACQIMRYAGISSRLKSLGIYNYKSNNNKNLKSEKLISQMVWCFLDGFFHKMKQFKSNDSNMVKYHVSMRKGDYNVCFYKNVKLEKWWMEVPVINAQDFPSSKNYYIPCSYNDYQMAVNGEIPERWWKAFKKINQE